MFAKPFYFIRHGETSWNKEKRVQGWADIQLNVAGVKQAHLAAMRMVPHDISHIYTSPLKRALQTAQIIAHKKQVQLDTVKGLEEVNFGALQGKLWSEIGDKHPLRPNNLDNTVPVHGGAETFIQLKERVKPAIENVLVKSQGTPLIVAHGGVYVVLLDVLGLSYESPQNAIPYYVTADTITTV